MVEASKSTSYQGGSKKVGVYGLTLRTHDAYMLIYEQYSDVFSVSGESCKCLLDLGRLSFLIDDQEVPLGIWRVCDMTDTCKKQARN